MNNSTGFLDMLFSLVFIFLVLFLLMAQQQTKDVKKTKQFEEIEQQQQNCYTLLVVNNKIFNNGVEISGSNLTIKENCVQFVIENKVLVDTIENLKKSKKNVFLGLGVY